tara:strand:+ start:387 stop:950 length:564 start_codon:yes stop_codon:yes gene_type:complete
MDYENFKKEFKKYDNHDWTKEDKKYDAFEEWTTDDDWEAIDKETNKSSKKWEFPNLGMYNQASLKDGRHWLRVVEGYEQPKSDIREKIDRFVHERFVGPVDNDGNFYHPEAQNDMVNSPAHYTRGSQEVIDIIEESIQDAPDVKAGMLQAQTLKYLLRLWLKNNAPQDAQKAQWYLTRLIKHLKETE